MGADFSQYTVVALKQRQVIPGNSPVGHGKCVVGVPHSDQYVCVHFVAGKILTISNALYMDLVAMFAAYAALATTYQLLGLFLTVCIEARLRFRIPRCWNLAPVDRVARQEAHSHHH